MKQDCAAWKKETEANIMRINWLVAVEMVTVISDPEGKVKTKKPFVQSRDVEGGLHRRGAPPSLSGVSNHNNNLHLHSTFQPCTSKWFSHIN